MKQDVVARYGELLGKRRESVALALRAIAAKKEPVIVELGASRSFVSGGSEGVMDADPKYWQPDRPEQWDWGAGIFSRVAAEAIAGTDAVLHSVDPSDRAIAISRTITESVGANVELHHTTSTEFLRSFDRPIDLLYMDHHETCEEGALLHLSDARLVLDLDLMAPDGVIAVDDVHVHGPLRERLVSVMRSFGGHRDLHFGKGKYSIPYLRSAGLNVLYEGYQVVLGRSGSHSGYAGTVLGSTKPAG